MKSQRKRRRLSGQKWEKEQDEDSSWERERERELCRVYTGDQLGRHHGTQAENSIIKRPGGYIEVESEVYKNEKRNKSLYKDKDYIQK